MLLLSLDLNQNHQCQRLICSTITPLNNLWTARESNPAQEHCKCFSPALEHGSPTLSYSRQDSNLHPLRSRRSIQPIGMLLYFYKELFRKRPGCISPGTLFPPSAHNHFIFLFRLSVILLLIISTIV